MVTAIILAGGTGQRMGLKGLPKQFLKLYGKPIICYTLQAFENCDAIDDVIVPCNALWVAHMKNLIQEYGFTKVSQVIDGGKDRQSSIQNGLHAIQNPSASDIVLIHDGVRPLLKEKIIVQNVEKTKVYGNAMTVKPNIETVVVTEDDSAVMEDFRDRKYTYTLTSPQSFLVTELLNAYEQAAGDPELAALPDASLLYARLGRQVHLVKDENLNLKITNPEDFYYLRSYLELNENKQILGL